MELVWPRSQESESIVCAVEKYRSARRVNHFVMAFVTIEASVSFVLFRQESSADLRPSVTFLGMKE